MTHLTPREADIGGLIVRRSLPVRELRSVGPWVFFDHMGPADFAPGKGLDVIPHPHINLATVTYLFEGEIIHRDSQHNVQTISPGEINLMVAGSGIAHSERTGKNLRASGHRAHGLQLWMALPVDHEEDEPGFHHYAADDLPEAKETGVSTRVMIGKAFGLVSPVVTYSPTVYLEAKLDLGSQISLPSDYSELGCYVVSGAVEINRTRIPAPGFVSFTDPAERVVSAVEQTTIVVIGGENLGKRYMWWNFISSKKERIGHAIESWAKGGFGSVPGDEEAAPLPDSDSFSAMKE